MRLLNLPAILLVSFFAPHLSAQPSLPVDNAAPPVTPVAVERQSATAATPPPNANPIAPVPQVPPAPYGQAYPPAGFWFESKETTEWYGWQTLTTDAVALGFTLTAAAVNEDGDAASGLLSLAGGTYLLGGPIVHAAHGNWGRAAGSLGMRVALPLAGLYTGALIADCSNHGGDFCGLGEGALGFLIGTAAAIALDASVLSYDTKPSAPRFVPMMQMGRDRTTIGVAGRF